MFIKGAFKIFLFSLLLSFIACNKGDCRKVHLGDFYYYTYHDSDLVQVQRFKTYQTEFNTFSEKHSTFDIEWIDECTYRLCPREKNTPKGCLVFRIENVKSNSHLVRGTGEIDLFRQIVYSGSKK